jgi:hypothetical protein
MVLPQSANWQKAPPAQPQTTTVYKHLTLLPVGLPPDARDEPRSCF